MQKEEHKNQVILQGWAERPPCFSHRNHGMAYQIFPLVVPRLSGAQDRLNIVLPEREAESGQIAEGAWLRVEGELRSYNDRSGTGSRLVITVLARKIGPGEGTAVNEVYLSGAICKEPVFRETPLGREICDLLLAVNRRYGRTDYLPCIAWGRVAAACSEMAVGAPLSIEGRVQSRNYHKVLETGVETRTAFEVSIMRSAL